MKKKLLSLLLALCMVSSLFVPAMAAEETPKPAPVPYVIGDVSGKLVILHTNDTHGGDLAGEKSVGTAGVAQLKKDFEAAGAEVLLLSAGDAIQGAPLVNQDKGKSEVEFMNAAGYDAMTAGNHEFDFGKDNLMELAKAMKFPILSANIVNKDTKKPVFDANKVFTTKSGLKVGVFGLATPETASKANPKFMEGLTFLQGEELYQCAQAQVDELKAAGCDLVVALGHLGVDEGSAPNRSIDVVAKVKGIDLFLDGHSHSDNATVAKAAGGSNTVNGTLVVSAGTKLAQVGVVTYADKKLTFDAVNAGSYTATESATAKLVTDRNTAVDAELATVFAKTEVDLNGSRSGGKATSTAEVDVAFPAGEGVRVSETNLGDFATDAILWQAREYLGGDDKVQAAFTNGGGIRETISKGDIAMKDMKAVFPFGNAVFTLDLTGAQILEMLEANLNVAPKASGGFPQVSGMTYAVDTTVPYENGEKYGDTTYFAPAKPGARVVDVTVAGAPLDLEKTYTLATNDFTAAGGDAYYVLNSAKNKFNTTVALEDALVNYTRDVLGGTISAKQYAAPAGRIQVRYAGVEGGAWYTDAAKYVLDNGIMSGTGNGFTPTGTVTRGTVFQTLYKMVGAPAVTEKATFTDIPEGSWYADAAAWAEDNGLATGTGESLFNGEKEASRAEIATILYRFAPAMDKVEPKADATLKEMADFATLPDWAVEGVTYCYNAKIIGGKEGKLLAPTDTAIRAELAKMLQSFCEAPKTYIEEAVTIDVPETDGVPAHQIPAIITRINDDTVKSGAVVMLHGTGSDKNEAGGGYAMAAPYMAVCGVATIRIDFMGNGASKADYKNYSYTSANVDAKAAADYMAKQAYIDPAKMGVMGWSQGGTNALLAAAKYPETFKAVATWAGATDLKILFGADGFEKAYATAKKDGGFEMKFDWRTPLMIGEQWFKDVKNTNVLTQVGKIKAPVLAVQGAKDTTVVPENADKIVKAAKNKDSLVYTVAEADHTFQVFSGDYAVIGEAIEATLGFFMQQFDGQLETSAASLSKYGNVTTTLPVTCFKGAGYALGDMVKVTIGETSLEMPFVDSYGTVLNGKELVSANKTGTLDVAINMGNFAKTHGVKVGTELTISLAKKAGYLDEYNMRNYSAKRTNVRADYKSDEIFANFRMVKMGKIADGMLYRTSSPANNELGRAAYADKLIEKAGVATVLNLADSKENLEGYFAAEGFASPYYKGLYDGGKVSYLNMGVDVKAEDFNQKLKTGLEFVIANGGPVAIHCTEGKDRAGFVSALLEALMGGTQKQITDDYMTSFVNYYGVVKDSKQYKLIAEENIAESLRTIAGLETGKSLDGVDLQKAAETYLKDTVKLSADQITALKTLLSTPIAAKKAA